MEMVAGEGGAAVLWLDTAARVREIELGNLGRRRKNWIEQR
jgi:hypothetical protein